MRRQAEFSPMFLVRPAELGRAPLGVETIGQEPRGWATGTCSGMQSPSPKQCFPTGVILLPKGLLSAESFHDHSLGHPTVYGFRGVAQHPTKHRAAPQRIIQPRILAAQGQKLCSRRKHRGNWASKRGIYSRDTQRTKSKPQQQEGPEQPSPSF